MFLNGDEIEKKKKSMATHSDIIMACLVHVYDNIFRVNICFCGSFPAFLLHFLLIKCETV